jgi:hypothetical protein
LTTTVFIFFSSFNRRSFSLKISTLTYLSKTGYGFGYLPLSPVAVFMESLKIWFEYHEISDTLRIHVADSITSSLKTGKDDILNFYGL